MNGKKYIGAHVSASGGVQNTPLAAAAIGAKAFALFTGFSNRWSSKPISKETAEQFKERCEANGFTASQILPHDNFLINLGSPDKAKLAMSRKSFLEEMQRCEALGLTMLNFHPGSHLNELSEEECLDRIAESINITLDQTSGVTAVLESTAGQGSNLGWRFEHLARIIEGVEDKTRVGVCVDTCHSHSAGYDLKSEEGYKKTWEEFDSIIGRSYLKALHLNDNKRDLGSRIDRHELIGKGSLGEEFFIRLVNDPRFDNMPLILETPDPENWASEISWLYSQIK
ncbi:MAG: deoxyribonuclease IV [Bacteroides sp.]|nr:deoxyribonuclease IV [Bacteroidales bacterium]MBD5305497.1 deoxyribonuclease IV [Bacteroides sp.]MBD5349172.1 deoxyribonuclease IV [Bacteroides sp.]